MIYAKKEDVFSISTLSMWAFTLIIFALVNLFVNRDPAANALWDAFTMASLITLSFVSGWLSLVFYVIFIRPILFVIQLVHPKSLETNETHVVKMNRTRERMGLSNDLTFDQVAELRKKGRLYFENSPMINFAVIAAIVAILLVDRLTAL